MASKIQCPHPRTRLFLIFAALASFHLLPAGTALAGEDFTALVRTLYKTDTDSARAALFAFNDYPALVKALLDKDDQVSGCAYSVLGRAGAAAVPALLPLLKDDNVIVRNRAAGVFEDMGVAAKDAAPALIASLKNTQDSRKALIKIGVAALPDLVVALQTCNDPAVLPGVFEVINELGPQAEDAVPALIKLLNGPQASHAAFALGRIGPAAGTAIPALSELLENPEYAQVCAFALRNIGSEALPALIAGLKQANSEVRAQILNRLKEMPAHAETIVPAVVELLELLQKEERISGHLRCVFGGVFLVIEQLQKKERTSVRKAAVEALYGIGPPAAAAVPALKTALNDPDLRSFSVLVLGQIGEEAIPALVAASSNDDPAVRKSAMDALQKMGPAAEPALPSILRALKDPHWDVRTSAAYALQSLGPSGKSAIPAMIEALDDAYYNVRGVAALSLGALKEDAAAAVPKLLAAAKGGDRELRACAAKALSQIAPGDPRTLAALTALLKDENSMVREAAATALKEMGPAAREALPALIAALKQSDANLREYVIYALGKAARTDAGIMPHLVEALKDENARVRMAAADALGGMKANAEDALPALEALRHDREFLTRQAVGNAIGNIQRAIKEKEKEREKALRAVEALKERQREREAQRGPVEQPAKAGAPPVDEF